MKQCTIVLPYPPSVNHYKQIGQLTRTKAGKLYQRRVNSPKTIEFYYEVDKRVRLEGLKSFLGAKISMGVLVYPPDRRKRDLDGILKVLCDSLQNAHVFDDDCQIESLVVNRMHVLPPDGKVIVAISELVISNAI